MKFLITPRNNTQVALFDTSGFVKCAGKYELCYHPSDPGKPVFLNLGPSSLSTKNLNLETVLLYYEYFYNHGGKGENTVYYVRGDK